MKQNVLLVNDSELLLESMAGYTVSFVNDLFNMY